MFCVALLCVLAAVAADKHGGATYVQPPVDGFSPRMRELLENCEGAGENTLHLIQALRSEMQASIKTAITTILAAHNISTISSTVSVGTRTCSTKCSRPRARARSMMAFLTFCSKPE